MPLIKLNTTRTNKATIYFENKIFLSFICIIRVDIPIGTVNFYVVDTPILFLFYLKDIDILRVYLNNIIMNLFLKMIKVFLFFINEDILSYLSIYTIKWLSVYSLLG